jgi:phospholipase C
MENKEHGSVIGSPSAPYTNALARRYASLTHMYGVTHPSLPNYFALTAGTTFGVTSDCTDCQQSGRNIADQLEAAKLSWRAYLGGMPSACFKGASSGRYAKKHNPFMYYPSVADNASTCKKVVPETQLARDLKAGHLPTFSFLAPDLCDDTHDCGVDSGDKYLARTVPPVLKALGPKGFLVLTYDEGSSNARGGGRIPTVIAGPGVKRGAKPSATYNHYATLRLIEDALRLPRLGHARDASVKSLGPAFKSGLPRLR